uniref:uncharacterized protein LOC122591575 n=1 Tax=Erigeron canadensis TaxID=72917 RepID=UPI001CB9C776|nr:uncharacterized protein LOC122591575 [Erigeron canadensis]
MHTQIILKADKKVLFCSFVYAHNSYTERRKLWDELRMHKLFVKDKPWAVLGDFNAALLVEDSSIGSSSSNIAMREFSECVNGIEVRDSNMSGFFYTWNQKPNGGMGILKKLDRVLANLELSDEFVGANVVFQPFITSDHSPAILKLPMVSKPKSNQFKFSNLLVHNPKFKELVSLGWKDNVKGIHMYWVVAKLKALKRPLKRLMFEQGNLHKNVEKLWVELDEVQRAMDKDASNLLIREDHAAILNVYNAAILAVERFLKQKSKVHRLRVGDSNTAYFHKAVKGRVARNRIDVVIDKFGIKQDGVAVFKAFIDHYSEFLGKQGNTIPLNSFELFSKKVSDHQAREMIRAISKEEIKNAIFSMGDEKSPGPDSFADDLFIFLHGDVAFASVIMDGLMEFKDVSGLSPSLEKSTAYFCNVLNYVKQDILGILPFEEG